MNHVSVGYSIDDIRRGNASGGQFFFDRAALRFFRSRVLSRVYEGPGGVYFVTSERQSAEHPRRYTTRRWDPGTGRVSTVGPFCQSSKGGAQVLAAALASGNITSDEVTNA